MKILKITGSKNQFSKGVTINGYFFVINRITQNFKLFDTFEEMWNFFEDITSEKI